MCARLRALPRETLYERPLSARRPRGAEEAGRPAVEGPAGLGGRGKGRAWETGPGGAHEGAERALQFRVL